MKSSCVIFIIIAIVSWSTTAYSWNSSKNQTWIDFSITGKLTDKIAVSYAENLRYIEKDFEYVYRHSDLKIGFKIDKYWTLSPAFRYVTKYNGETETSTPCWYINIDNKSSYKNISLLSRLRIFYGDASASDDTIDARPKFVLSPKKGWTNYNIKPYVADELFFDLHSGNDFYRNRLSAGVKISPIPQGTLSAFLMHQYTETSGSWHEVYNMGIGAALKF